MKYPVLLNNIARQTRQIFAIMEKIPVNDFVSKVMPNNTVVPSEVEIFEVKMTEIKNSTRRRIKTPLGASLFRDRFRRVLSTLLLSAFLAIQISPLKIIPDNDIAIVTIQDRENLH